jgi:hypothetical protein
LNRSSNNAKPDDARRDRAITSKKKKKSRNLPNALPTIGEGHEDLDEEEDKPSPTSTPRPLRSPSPTPIKRKHPELDSAPVQSRLDYSTKASESSRKIKPAPEAAATKARYDLSPYQAGSSQPATFDTLGLTAFGDRAIQSWSNRMSYKAPQVKFHRKAIADLQGMLIDLSEVEMQIHKRLLLGAVISWGANGSKLGKLSCDSLTKVLAACYALSH